MSKAVVILRGQANRDRAAKWCRSAPEGTTVTFQQNKRTTPQNKKMWALLTRLSKVTKYHGHILSPRSWKVLFAKQVVKETVMLPSLDGQGIVDLSGSTSDMTVEQMTEVIELVLYYAATNNLDLGEV